MNIYNLLRVLKEQLLTQNLFMTELTSKYVEFPHFVHILGEVHYKQLEIKVLHKIHL